MSVRGAAIWAMSSQYMAFAINFFASIYLARHYIGPDELGLFSIAFAATTLIAVLQDFGLTRYIAGEAELDDRKIRTAFSLSLVIAWLIAFVSMSLAWPMAQLYELPRLMPVMLVIGASYLLVPFAVIPTALRQREMDFKSNTMIEVGASLANAAISISLAAEGMGALALAWGAFAQQVARALVSQWRNGFLFPWPLSFNGAKPVLRFGGGSSLLVLSGSLGEKMPDLIIGRVLTEAAVGLFARANGLAAQLRHLVSGAVTSVFYPAFARVRDRGEELGPPYERVVASYCAVTWPSMVGLAVLAEPLIRILYGERWIATAPLLQWIALSQLCFVALPLHVELPILLGRMKALIHRNFLDTFASIAFLAAGAMVSLEIAAASRLAYGLVWIGIYAGFLQKLIGFRWSAMLRIYLQSGIAAFASVAPILLIYAFVQGPAELDFVMMVAGAAAGVLLWLITLAVLRHPAFDEIRGLSEPFLRKLQEALG
ncbi:MAG: oligosaccharide flippase family protein [Novosphingobium sp.]|nr:oligosaccharide flippase family protein [Novosphingobium sp.]